MGLKMTVELKGTGIEVTDAYHRIEEVHYHKTANQYLVVVESFTAREQATCFLKNSYCISAKELQPEKMTENFIEVMYKKLLAMEEFKTAESVFEAGQNEIEAK